MPFKSEKQRRFLWKNEPDVAKKWSKEYGSKIQSAAKSRLSSKGSQSQPPVGKK